MGDKNIITGEIDDLAVSNNADREKILATVVDTVYSFLDHHPDAWIFASGSTEARTRLYRIGIAKYYDEISQDFDIYGQVGNRWYPFERNREYVAFLVITKSMYI